MYCSHDPYMNAPFWYYTHMIITHETHIEAEDQQHSANNSSPTTNSSVLCHSDFEKTDVPEMESMHVNAPSSSEMNCNYPPHSKKPSKQRKHDNKRTHPLFFLRSSPPSLRLGHRCRHCGSLHLSVSCV